MGDGLPEFSCPDDPAMLELSEFALAMMRSSTQPLLTFLESGGELKGALAEELAACIRDGTIQVSLGTKRGPSVLTKFAKQRRNYDIGSYVYVRVLNSSRAHLKRILFQAHESFDVPVGQCRKAYNEFKRVWQLDPFGEGLAQEAFSRALDSFRAEGVAVPAACQERIAAIVSGPNFRRYNLL